MNRGQINIKKKNEILQNTPIEATGNNVVCFSVRLAAPRLSALVYPCLLLP
jgi:hypothetical protein